MDQDITILPDLSDLPPATIVNHLSKIIFTVEKFNGLGKNREKYKTCLTRSQTDYEAFQAWLVKYKNKSPLTYSQYQREIERLFIWAITERKKVLSDFDVEDFQEYLSFVSNPSPRETWCMQPTIKTSYGSALWKPFTAPLGKSARAKTITIIRTMLDFWVKIGYLSLNPLHAIVGKGDNIDANTQMFTSQARILEPNELEALVLTLYDLPEKSLYQKHEKMRSKLIVMLLFFLGVRIDVLSTHTWGAFQKQGEFWWFFVRGKGNKQGKIPVHNILLEEVKLYREYFKWSSEPSPLETEPLVPRFRKNKALTTRRIHGLIKDLAKRTADSYFQNNPAVQMKFEKFSTHWMRHIALTWQDMAHIEDIFIKANAMHSKIETTNIYRHTFDNKRHEEIQKVNLPGRKT
ncbi:MAG: site-specific integrase [Chlamydiae bacterium]|nr:site-specific integrase [Chlamydiota bacterium]